MDSISAVESEYIHCDVCCMHRMEVCSLLLSHGADPTIPNCHSKTALDLSTSDLNRERLDSELREG